GDHDPRDQHPFVEREQHPDHLRDAEQQVCQHEHRTPPLQPRPSSRERAVALATPPATTSTKPPSSSARRPASVVPPGDVTIARSSSGERPVSWSITAAPRIVW